MAKYKVIKYFTDLQDSNFAYHVGDTYPREGKDVSPSRIAELAGSDNKRGVPLIELVKSATQKAKAETVEEKANESEVIPEAETVEDEASEEKPKTRAKKTTKK